MNISNTGLQGADYENIREELRHCANFLMFITMRGQGHLGDSISGIRTTISILDIQAYKLYDMFKKQKLSEDIEENEYDNTCICGEDCPHGERCNNGVCEEPVSPFMPSTAVEKVIQRIRESFSEAERIYTQGACVQFALILATIFPGGRILYDIDHAIYEYDGRCYDIRGQALKTSAYVPIEEYGISMLSDMLKPKL